MRLLDFDSGRGELRILFPYDKSLLALVRELPGRRWNADDKYWSVPTRHVGEAVKQLLPHGFSPSEDLREYLADGDLDLDALGDGPVPAPATAPTTPTPSQTRADSSSADNTWSVTTLNERVRAALAGAFPAPVWIQGEVIGFDRNAHKSHVYFQLAEKQSDDDRPQGVVTAVLFANARSYLEARLREGVEPLQLCDGVQVRVLVRVDLYPPSGSYQVIVEDIDPAFTLGEMARRQERILAEVRREGVADANLELPIPVPCLRIGLITSFESDAYNDFVNELARSGYAFEVDVWDCHVQGARVEADVLRALEQLAAQRSDYDAVAIVRGGGSRTDLMGFDSLPLALAVARHPLKVMVGIGHHRDRCVLDFLAHSEKTPTAVAQALVARVQEEERRLQSEAGSIARCSEAVIQGRIERFERTALLLTRSLELRLERGFHGVRTAAAALREVTVRRLQREHHRFTSQRQRLLVTPLDRVRAARHDLQRRSGEVPRRAAAILERVRSRVEAQQLRVDGANPQRVLARGYAWLQLSDGSTLASVDQAEPGAEFTARLRDGQIQARVEPDSTAPRQERRRPSPKTPADPDQPAQSELDLG